MGVRFHPSVPSLWKVVPVNKRKAYRATNVNHVRFEELVRNAAGCRLTVGTDVGKYEIFGVLRWPGGEFERPWKAKNPSDIRFVVEQLRSLADCCDLKVAMEPTGTYGDPLRAQLHQQGIELVRVGGKAAHDYAEIFDGVPSQHDGKDAAVVAELAAIGKCQPWVYRELGDEDAELAYWVDWLDAQDRIMRMWTGRLEGLLARHWPEATRLIDLHSITLLSALAHYGGPAALAADSSAATRLAQWGRYSKDEPVVAEVVASATQTVGVAQRPAEVQRMRDYAALALAAYRETQKAARRLTELAAGNETLLRMAHVIGACTACVLWVILGDPANYPCGSAYRKAAGLNLKERSSGQYRGQLKITKRGSSMVRRWLYFAALRTVQDPLIRPWFEAKKAKDKGRGNGALIAVARKLMLALYAVGARGETFDARRLLPGRPLNGDFLSWLERSQVGLAVQVAEEEIPF